MWGGMISRSMQRLHLIKLCGWAGLLMTALLCSCGDTTSEFSKSPCRLYINNQTEHHDAVLAQAMTQYSGVFVTVTLTSQSGAQYFAFKSNQGGSSTAIFMKPDQERLKNSQIILGMNGALIVGYGNSTDGTFYAYDRECPNCFDPNALPMKSYPLTVGSNGIATCATCHRGYDLNNGGVVAAGDGGTKMTRYYASTTGPYGVLSVW